MCVLFTLREITPGQNWLLITWNEFLSLFSRVPVGWAGHSILPHDTQRKTWAHREATVDDMTLSETAGVGATKGLQTLSKPRQTWGLSRLLKDLPEQAEAEREFHSLSPGEGSFVSLLPSKLRKEGVTRWDGNTDLA